MSENTEKNVILGCGEVGRRIAKQLISRGISNDSIVGFVNSEASATKAQELGISCQLIDADNLMHDLNECHKANIYYTIAPQKSGDVDLRSAAIISSLKHNSVCPNKIVLISTTGLYGDCNGQWVTEDSPVRPQTGRGQRRLSAEKQWLEWGAKADVEIVILRVPGIYARSRLPKKRLESAIPVVMASECGFTNRVHADDLANMCAIAMQKAPHGEIYNASDGVPGKIAEYLQAAAASLDLPPLPEISMSKAHAELSTGMLSYLNESRKISNRKILNDLNIELLYPDYKIGILN